MSVVGGMGEEVPGGGDREVVESDVAAPDCQAQELLALPGRVVPSAVGHVRLRCWRAR